MFALTLTAQFVTDCEPRFQREAPIATGGAVQGGESDRGAPLPPPSGYLRPAVLLMRTDVGKPTNVTPLQYWRGVLYRKGIPQQDLGAGRGRRVWLELKRSSSSTPTRFRRASRITQSRLWTAQPRSMDFPLAPRFGTRARCSYLLQNFSQVPAHVLLCRRRIILMAMPATRSK
jgi:hypothetical protein